MITCWHSTGGLGVVNRGGVEATAVEEAKPQIGEESARILQGSRTQLIT